MIGPEPTITFDGASIRFCVTYQLPIDLENLTKPGTAKSVLMGLSGLQYFLWEELKGDVQMAS